MAPLRHKGGISVGALCHLGAYACQELGPYDMVELKIALMIAMIAILFFAIYFTAIPG